MILAHDVFPHHHHYNCTVIPPKAETNHCDKKHPHDHDHSDNHDDKHNNSFPDHCHAFNSLKYQNENNYTKIEVLCMDIIVNIFNSDIIETPIIGIRVPFRNVFIKKPLVINSHNLRAPPIV